MLNTGTLFAEYVVPNPVKAVGYLQKNNIAGMVFNDEKFGGYLLWSAYPQLRPFVDGRQLDKKRFFDDYLALVQAPERLWPDLQERYRFAAVLLDKTPPYLQKLREYLKGLPSWALVYEDESCVVFRNASTVTDRIPALNVPDNNGGR